MIEPVISLVARRYDTQKTVRIQIERGLIHSIVELPESDDSTTDLPWVAPGLIDLQVNGFGGIGFNSPSLTPQQVEQVSLALDPHGVTGYCATITTDSWENLAHAMTTVGRAIETRPAVKDRVLGIHLEGPYLCPDDGPRGAHPARYVRPPDWDEFRRLQDLADGQIRIVTLSPEYDNAPEFIRQAVAQGVLVAIGHTKADSRQIRAAVDAGARLSTHLGNGAHRQLPRHPNYLWDQLGEDRLIASLIVDGHHLPPSVVKTFLRAKTPSRCILISDVTSMAGMPPGRYTTANSGDVEVLEDGLVVIAGQRHLLAGAALPITVGLAHVIRDTQYGLGVAVEMATLGPARLIGCQAGRLEVGTPADLVLLRLPLSADHEAAGSIRIEATIHGGSVVWGELPP
jgi:N-acetylglucosamine-6-phosphate deacetylase